MDERTTGLILRTRILTETSLIVHWLTSDFGRMATVAKGARRPKSPFRGKLDLFYLADLSFVRSRRSDLHTLREVAVRETPRALRQDLAYLQQASYCAMLVEQTSETDTPLSNIFTLLTGFVRQLPREPPRPQMVLAFELKLLEELGQSPVVAARGLSAGARQILEKLTALDWPELSRVKPSAAQCREIQEFLHGFMIYHLGKIPIGRSTALG